MIIRQSKRKITIFSGYLKVSLTYRIRKNEDGTHDHVWEDNIRNIHLWSRVDDSKYGRFDFVRKEALKFLAECFKRRKCKHPVMHSQGEHWKVCPDCGHSQIVKIK